MRAAGRDPLDRLEEVGLALAVLADEERHPGLEEHVGRDVAAHVDQVELLEVHLGFSSPAVGPRATSRDPAQFTRIGISR